MFPLPLKKPPPPSPPGLSAPLAFSLPPPSPPLSPFLRRCERTRLRPTKAQSKPAKGFTVPLYFFISSSSSSRRTVLIVRFLGLGASRPPDGHGHLSLSPAPNPHRVYPPNYRFLRPPKLISGSTWNSHGACEIVGTKDRASFGCSGENMKNCGNLARDVPTAGRSNDYSLLANVVDVLSYSHIVIAETLLFLVFFSD